MAKPRSKTKKILFAVEIIVLLLFIGGLYVYGQLNSKMDKIQQPAADTSQIQVNQEVQESIEAETSKLTGFTTYALFGIDHRDKSAAGGMNSDTMIIASINNDTKKVKLVSIYRDTYLRVGSNSDGENVYNKANSAFCTGGPEKMMTMMNKNLDLNIVDYVTVDFKGVAEAVELLGGIDVDLKEEEIEHLNNYCVETSEVTGMDYTPLKKVAGVHHLNGVQTVAYARIRYTAGNDFRRAARQREVIYKIVEKAKNSSISTLSKVLDKVFPLIKTSLTKPEILQMGMSMLSYDIEDQTGFPFDHLYGGVVEDAMDGLDCVLPITLESNVIKLHEFLYPEDSYVPSDEVKTYSQKIIEISGFGEESRLDHSEDGSLAAYHESDTESANPAENSADSQEESQTDVTDDTQGYDDCSLEQ